MEIPEGYKKDTYSEERLERSDKATEPCEETNYLLHNDDKPDVLCGHCGCGTFKIKYGIYEVRGICNNCNKLIDIYN